MSVNHGIVQGLHEQLFAYIVLRWIGAQQRYNDQDNRVLEPSMISETTL